MNNCGEHGTCNDQGQCECKANFGGADCSKFVYGHSLETDIIGEGTQWYYIYDRFHERRADEAFKLTVTGNVTYDMYITQEICGDSTPSQYKFD